MADPASRGADCPGAVDDCCFRGVGFGPRFRIRAVVVGTVAPGGRRRERCGHLSVRVHRPGAAELGLVVDHGAHPVLRAARRVVGERGGYRGTRIGGCCGVEVCAGVAAPADRQSRCGRRDHLLCGGLCRSGGHQLSVLVGRGRTVAHPDGCDRRGTGHRDPRRHGGDRLLRRRARGHRVAATHRGESGSRAVGDVESDVLRRRDHAARTADLAGHADTAHFCTACWWAR